MPSRMANDLLRRSVFLSAIMNHSLGSEQELSLGVELACVGVRGPSGLAGTILYVEDEAFVRDVTAEVLRGAGYQVLVAKNAAEAVDIFERWRPDVDLLLTDVIMPGETGQMLAARLWRMDPQLNVLYVTGYTEQMRMRSTAHEDCLPKPFSTDALLERVSRMAGQKENGLRIESEAMRACVGA
jgi:CheY-like chemotaxis protein